MTKRYQIVAATASGNHENTLLYRSLIKLNHDNVDVGLDITTSNKQGLAKLYNQKLEQYADVDYLILCHDDISIEDASLYEKIDQAIGDHSAFSVCGVAGSRECHIGDRNLWHIMYKGFGTNVSPPFSGAIAHYTDETQTKCHMTACGPTPQRVAILDGVFLALKVKDVLASNARFDEGYPSKFHFYDIDFSLECNRAGLKLTTWPIWMIHASVGLTDPNDEQWNKGNQHFIDKWVSALS